MLENILAKQEKVDFCEKELNILVSHLQADLKGVADENSKYKGLYPFEYKEHIEINKTLLDGHIDELIKHLNYMKEKIKHDETYLEKR